MTLHVDKWNLTHQSLAVSHPVTVLVITSLVSEETCLQGQRASHEPATHHRTRVVHESQVTTHFLPPWLSSGIPRDGVEDRAQSAGRKLH